MYCTVASSRVNFKTHQYSISYPVRNGSKRFRICLLRKFVNQLTKMTIPNRFQTEKSGRKQKTVWNIVWTVLIHDPVSDKSIFYASLGDFSNRKLGFLKSSENSGHFWPLLAPSGSFWPLLVTSDHFWSLLATSGHFFWRIKIFRADILEAVRKTIIWVGVRQPGAAEKSINRSKAVIVWRSEPIRDSEFDWTSSAVHGKDSGGVA